MLHHAFFDFAWVVGERAGGLQRLIGGLKFLYMRATAGALADLLDSSLPPLPRGCVLVPIPTIRPHIRQRGYDHMLLIARRLSKRRRTPVAKLLCRRHAAVQHESNRRDRLRQAMTAFEVCGRVESGITYVILDDVVTTGATVCEAARELREAGAKAVWVVALAKQTLD
jgi:ComF family protein